MQDEVALYANYGHVAFSYLEAQVPRGSMDQKQISRFEVADVLIGAC